MLRVCVSVNAIKELLQLLDAIRQIRHYFDLDNIDKNFRALHLNFTTQ